MSTFSTKDASERIMLSFDFANVSSVSPSNPVVTVIKRSGTGTYDVSTMIVGSAQIVGSNVMQLVEGGDNGDDYTIRCSAECGSEKFVVAAVLPVRYFDGK